MTSRGWTIYARGCCICALACWSTRRRRARATDDGHGIASTPTPGVVAPGARTVGDPRPLGGNQTHHGVGHFGTAGELSGMGTNRADGGTVDHRRAVGAHSAGRAAVGTALAVDDHPAHRGDVRAGRWESVR